MKKIQFLLLLLGAWAPESLAMKGGRDVKTVEFPYTVFIHTEAEKSGTPLCMGFIYGSVSMISSSLCPILDRGVLSKNTTFVVRPADSVFGPTADPDEYYPIIEVRADPRAAESNMKYILIMLAMPGIQLESETVTSANGSSLARAANFMDNSDAVMAMVTKDPYCITPGADKKVGAVKLLSDAACNAEVTRIKKINPNFGGVTYLVVETDTKLANTLVCGIKSDKPLKHGGLDVPPGMPCAGDVGAPLISPATDVVVGVLLKTWCEPEDQQLALFVLSLEEDDVTNIPVHTAKPEPTAPTERPPPPTPAPAPAPAPGPDDGGGGDDDDDSHKKGSGERVGTSLLAHAAAALFGILIY